MAKTQVLNKGLEDDRLKPENMPLVSVIIATYRRESLNNALKSIATQTYPNIEIVVIDDNSEPIWNEKVKYIGSGFSKKKPASKSSTYSQ